MLGGRTRPSPLDASRIDQPLVRAPGAPEEVICTSLDEPLVDPHGRRWRIERVRFLERAGLRTGGVRPGADGRCPRGRDRQCHGRSDAGRGRDVRAPWGTATEPRPHRARGAHAGSDPGARPGGVPARGDGPGQGALRHSRRWVTHGDPLAARRRLLPGADPRLWAICHRRRGSSRRSSSTSRGEVPRPLDGRHRGGASRAECARRSGVRLSQA